MIVTPAGAIITRAPRRALAALFLLVALLAAGALGAGVLGARDARGRPIVVGHLPNALALDPDTGRAFVAADGDATVRVLDLASGQLLRTVRVGTPSALAPLTLALDRATHRVFVANRGDDGAPSVVRVLDSRSGAPLATLRVGPGATALAIDERAGHAFVANEGAGTVSLLDARTGALLRTTALGLVPVALAVNVGAERVFVAGPVEPGPAYGPGREPRPVAGRVSVLDTRSGALLRTVRVGASPVALAVDARTGRAFVVAADDNTLSVLDTRDGRVRRTVAVGIMPVAVAVNVRRHRVYVVNAGDGTLSLLDARTGTLRHTRPLAPAAGAFALAPYALAVDEARDRVYVTAWGRLDQAGVFVGKGRLFVLDAREGTVLRSIVVGVAPRVVTVESGSGRIVVVDSGGMVRAPQGWLERCRQAVAGWTPWLGRIAPPALDVVQVPGRVQVLTIDAGTW